jgi:hypothetical protein
LSGTLNDTTTLGQPMGGHLITVTGTYTVAGQLHTVTRSATTNQVGSWSTSVTTADVGARFTWQAAFAGDNGFHASQAPSRVLSVQPTLTATANLPWNGTQYSAPHGTLATVSGVSTPAMAGATLKLQTKLKGTTTWVASGITVTVAANGAYSTAVSFPSAVKEYLRLSYTGSSTGPWLTTKSPARLFVIS